MSFQASMYKHQIRKKIKAPNPKYQKILINSLEKSAAGKMLFSGRLGYKKRLLPKPLYSNNFLITDHRSLNYSSSSSSIRLSVTSMLSRVALE